MLFRWLRDRRRRRLLARPIPPAWPAWLEGLPFYTQLDEGSRRDLEQLARVVVAEKNWEGCGGLELTEEMIVKIASQASLLLLRIEHDYFRNLRSIFVYPTAYRTPAERYGDDETVSEGAVLLGEAWYRGPVVLAWDEVVRDWSNPRDGRNLVLHEFAHQLDFLDGTADGTPPLADAGSYRTWREVMTVRYQALVRADDEGTVTLLDKYGATDPAEFFAVSTECFFERGDRLAKRHPELYALLRDYYHQDPATWPRPTA